MVSAVRDRSGRVAQMLARPHDGRDESLAERFYQMLALPPHRLEDALRRMIQSEHELPDAARYPAAQERLRAWLELDVEHARILARAWDAAIRTFPEEYRSRAIEAERAVILNGMPFADFRALAGILPWLRGEQGLELLLGEEVRPARERELVAA